MSNMESKRIAITSDGMGQAKRIAIAGGGVAMPSSPSSSQASLTTNHADRASVSRRVPRHAITSAVRAVGMLAASFAIVATLVLTVGPRFLPYQTFIVLSSSMEPAIPVGAVVVTVPVPRNDLVSGDVITYQRAEEPDIAITHRIVRLTGVAGALIARTRGDANLVDDPWEVRLSETVLRVQGYVPLAGYVLMFAQSPSGRLVMIVAPALLLVAIWAFEQWQRRVRRRSHTPDGLCIVTPS